MLSKAARDLANDPSAWLNLATAEFAQEDHPAAVASFSRAAELQPDRAQTWILLASAEFESGQTEVARKHYARSLELDGRWPTEMNSAAWNLATASQKSARNGRRAVQLARRVCQATNDAQPEFLETLAAAYAEVGKLMRPSRQNAERQAALGRLKLYQAEQTYP